MQITSFILVATLLASAACALAKEIPVVKAEHLDVAVAVGADGRADALGEGGAEAALGGAVVRGDLLETDLVLLRHLLAQPGERCRELDEDERYTRVGGGARGPMLRSVRARV